MRQLLLVPYHRRLTIGSAKKNQVQSQQNTKGAYNKTLIGSMLKLTPYLIQFKRLSLDPTAALESKYILITTILV